MILAKKTDDQDNILGYDEVLLTHLNYDGRGGAVAECDGEAMGLSPDLVEVALRGPSYRIVAIRGMPVRDGMGRDEVHAGAIARGPEASA